MTPNESRSSASGGELLSDVLTSLCMLSSVTDIGIEPTYPKVERFPFSSLRPPRLCDAYIFQMTSAKVRSKYLK